MSRFRMTVIAAALSAVALLGLQTQPAGAHAQSTGFLAAVFNGDAFDGRLEIALRDVDRLHDLDRDGDRTITWGEVRTREAEIARLLLGGVTLGSPDEPCRLLAGPLAVDTRGGEAYLVVPFAGSCPAFGGTARVGYDLVFGVDAQHRAIVDIRSGTETASAVLGPSRKTVSLDLGSQTTGAIALDFVAHGIHHIWIGLDHILFIVTLLLSAVLVRRDGHWAPAESLRAIGWATAKVVTAFTIAHSITLALAVLDLVRLPSALVESVIALSIIVAAVNVIFPVVTGRLWMAAFVFGLMHGFGFASVLAELDLPAGHTLLALLAFNIGVEIGQLAIVAVVLPLLYAARTLPAYSRYAMPAGAGVIAVVAGAWFLERSMGVEVPLFG